MWRRSYNLGRGGHFDTGSAPMVLFLTFCFAILLTLYLRGTVGVNGAVMRSASGTLAPL